MSAGAFRKDLQKIAPALVNEVNTLVAGWLPAERLRGGFRPKQVNDPIWGTVELLPWEVALLDTPLLQRMRGVKQLGLAPPSRNVFVLRQWNPIFLIYADDTSWPAGALGAIFLHGAGRRLPHPADSRNSRAGTSR